jgi:uncharacterized repeat protein (TIGR01451 family)
VRRISTAAALAIMLVLSAFVVAQAVVPASPTNQHFPVVVHTDRGGQATLDLQVAVNPADVVVKVAAGGDHLGGEDPSFATVNFGGFVDSNTIRVRVIGWHANVVTGEATFRYYANKDVTLFVNVYERTTAPVTPPSANLSVTKTAVDVQDPEGGDTVGPIAALDDTFEYRIVVSNAGPNAAANVVVLDDYPSDLDAAVEADADCTVNAAGDVRCVVASLASGASRTFVVTGRTNGSTGASFSNAVTVSSDTADPVPTNNSFTLVTNTA